MQSQAKPGQPRHVQAIRAVELHCIAASHKPGSQIMDPLTTSVQIIHKRTDPETVKKEVGKGLKMQEPGEARIVDLNGGGIAKETRVRGNGTVNVFVPDAPGQAGSDSDDDWGDLFGNMHGWPYILPCHSFDGVIAECKSVAEKVHSLLMCLMLSSRAYCWFAFLLM